MMNHATQVTCSNHGECLMPSSPRYEGSCASGRHYLFVSHDGFGLGHARRNWVIARAVLDAEPSSTATLVTGIDAHPSWLGGPRMSVVRVPPLIKHSTRGYVSGGRSFDESIRLRRKAFLRVVRCRRPDVVVVDRHPYGTAGELRPGLEEAAAQGAALVLGLRDVLDDPRTVTEELAGRGWDDVATLFDEVVVYGSPEFCDHEREYALPMAPTYCGWVVGPIRTH